MKEKLRVLLVDDHEILRKGLQSLLDMQPDIEIVGQAADGAGAVRLASELSPDLVIMDIVMPTLNGIDATRKIIEERPLTRVLCLTMHKSRQMVTAAFHAGASGYLLKTCALEELTSAIRTVASGQTYISSFLTTELIQGHPLSHAKNNHDVFSQVSDREREVLQLIAEGLCTKEIAIQLSISEKTVAVHRQSIMEKLHLKSVADLTRYAIREGLIEA